MLTLITLFHLICRWNSQSDNFLTRHTGLCSIPYQGGGCSCYISLFAELPNKSPRCFTSHRGHWTHKFVWLLRGSPPFFLVTTLICMWEGVKIHLKWTANPTEKYCCRFFDDMKSPFSASRKQLKILDIHVLNTSMITKENNGREWINQMSFSWRNANHSLLEVDIDKNVSSGKLLFQILLNMTLNPRTMVQ